MVSERAPGTEPSESALASTGSSRVLDEIGLVRAAELLRVLGSAHRLAIVLELANGPRCVHELVGHLQISQSLTSQHLRVLRTSGLVVGTRRGKETAYALADDHVVHIARDALAHGGEPAPARPDDANIADPPPPTAAAAKGQDR